MTDDKNKENGAPNEQPSGPARRRGDFKSADDVLLGELPFRAGNSSPKLKELITGSVIISVSNLGKKYLFDCSQAQPKIEMVTDSAVGECVITLSEDNLIKVAKGDLNPQIAMLAKKIQVEGKKTSAVYFFNLIAPHQAI